MSAQRLTDLVEALREANPMLGHRGCRLCVTYPEILAMQVRAIVETELAAFDRLTDGLAGSGLVAFGAATGVMPLDMPESVLVRFKGKFNPGITLRDAVNAIPYWAIQKGLLTVPKKNKKNVFNGRILEMEGLPDLTVEQAFELTDAAAERSAAAACVALSEKTIATYLRSNAGILSVKGGLTELSGTDSVTGISFGAGGYLRLNGNPSITNPIVVPAGATLDDVSAAVHFAIADDSIGQG